MSQRNDCKDTALRAYHCMLAHHYEIDVFTYTSLLDVIGRNAHFDEALMIYDKMRAGQNQPNVVTFVTLIRVLAGWHGKGPATADVERAKTVILRLLREAEELVQGSQGRGAAPSSAPCPPPSPSPPSTSAPVFVSGSDGRLEVTVYNAALAGFLKLHDLECFVRVLQRMHAQRVEPIGRTLDILCKFYNVHLATSSSASCQFPDINEYGAYLVERHGISAHTSGLLEGNLHAYLERKAASQGGGTLPSGGAGGGGGGGGGSNTCTGDEKLRHKTGCLGQNATPSMREAVMTHDMDKLLARLTPSDSSQLQESDFVTLLHQCRKRKWGDQIATVLRGMLEVSSRGVPGRGVSPLPALAPSLLAYEAALAGYFSTGAAGVAAAWELFLGVCALPEVWEGVSFDSSEVGAQDDTFTSNALHFFRFVMKGFLRCGEAGRAFDAFAHMQSMGVSPTFPLVKCLLRGSGCEPRLGVALLENLLTSPDEVFLQSYALTSVEGYTNPKLSQNVHLCATDMVKRGNRELLCTLFESMAVLGRPEEVVGAAALCSGSACAALRGLMAGLMAPQKDTDTDTETGAGRETETETRTDTDAREVDVPFTMTLLMAAASTNSLPAACSFLVDWQRRGLLPPVALLYSLVLEALAGSIDGTSQREVCAQMPSLPFRGFLRVSVEGDARRVMIILSVYY
jgi:pentatricopeptide repeat protein